jgi:hypothetical protein
VTDDSPGPRRSLTVRVELVKNGFAATFVESYRDHRESDGRPVLRVLGAVSHTSGTLKGAIEVVNRELVNWAERSQDDDAPLFRETKEEAKAAAIRRA